MTIEEFKNVFEKQYLIIDWKVVYPELRGRHHFIGTRNDIEMKLYAPDDNFCVVYLAGVSIKVPKEIYQKVSDMVDEQNKKQTEIILSEFWK